MVDMKIKSLSCVQIYNLVIDNIAFVITAILVFLACIFWVLAVYVSPINPDAGYYLTAGKLIANGFVPYKDFSTAYSPGSYYLFAIAEFFEPQFAQLQKGIIYFLHILNGLLLSRLLISLHIEKNLSLFSGMLFIIMVFNLDGQAVVLEPFQNFFILLSLLAAVSLKEYKAAFSAGFFMGCALMMKQSSLFSAPVIFAIVLFPGFLKLNYKKTNIKKQFITLLLLGFSAGIPFLLFCLFTQQEYISTFVSLVTFGGGATKYVENQYGLYEVFTTFVLENGGQRILIPFYLATLLLIFTGKNKLYFLFIFGLVLNSIPILFIRGYPHYIQLVAVWGVIIFAFLLNSIDHQNKHQKNLLYILLLSQLLAPTFATMYNLKISLEDGLILNQKVLTTQINRLIKKDSSTLIVGYPWLYYTSDITPEGLNMGFISFSDQLNLRSKNANNIIIMSDYVDKFDNLKDEVLKLNASGKFQVNQLKFGKQQVHIYTRKISKF